MKTKSDLLLQYGKKILINDTPEGNIDTDELKTKEIYTATLMNNMESLGYTLSQKAYQSFINMPLDIIKNKGVELLDFIENQSDFQINYNMMYPNFPEQVMKMNDFELYSNALIHYWSGGTLMPEYEKEKRFPLIDRNTLKVIDTGNEKDLEKIMSNLVKSEVSLAYHTLDDITAYYNDEGWFKALKCDIPNKENLSYYCAKSIDKNPKGDKYLEKNIKTATDVLRIAVALSDGDRSLSEQNAFRKFKRPEKRTLLNLLNSCKNLEEDMWRRPEEFKRLAAYLGARDYPYFKEANKAFESVSKGEKPLFYNGRVEKAFYEKDLDDVLSLLSQRPGEFARKLDRSLRSFPEQMYTVLNAFTNKKVINKVPVSTLLQIREKYLHEDPEYRIFFPKGNISKSYNLKDERKPLDKAIKQRVVGACEYSLIERFKNKDFMGKVYLNPEFKNHNVPFALRSSNDSKVTMSRGSSAPIKENAEIVRAFIWWTNNQGGYSCDIDLSSVLYDKEWGYIEHVSWTNLKSDCAVHSGDIVSGGPKDGEGVSEFIDINRKKLKNNDIAYVVFQVHSFSGQNFGSLSNCKFGWMEREDMKSGEVYEPKTVKQSMDLVTANTSVVPVIYDVNNNKFIWADMTIGFKGERQNRVENTLSRGAAACYSVINMKKPNLYDLIDMHVIARGEYTDNKDDADIIFNMEKEKDRDVITPYDLDVFIGEYLENNKTREVAKTQKPPVLDIMQNER